MSTRFSLRPFRSLAESCKVDRAALVVLYEAIYRSSGIRNAGWNARADLRDWEGVSVNRKGRVMKLELPSKDLPGKLSVPLPTKLYFKLHLMQSMTIAQVVVVSLSYDCVGLRDEHPTDYCCTV